MCAFCWENWNKDVPVKHRGPCKIEVGGPKGCSKAKVGCSPVDMLPLVLCGSDDKTYIGQCALMKANCRSNKEASIKYLGSCKKKRPGIGQRKMY